MLKRPLPNKPRWFAGLAFVTLLTFATGWTVWAAQPPVAPAGGLVLQMKLKLNGGDEHVENAVMQPGQAKEFSYTENGERWEMTLTLDRLEADQIHIAADIRRDGVSQGQPRMITKLGAGAAIGIGDQYPDQFKGIEIEMMVTEPVVTTDREAVKTSAMSPVDTKMPWQLAVARWNGEPPPPAGC